MGETIKILLVDDEARNLDALEAILAEPGYTLIRADDADRALRLLLEHDVAAIVLDIKMPGVSGFELAQMIKGTKRFRQIPIVFLTAHLLEDQDILQGYDVGAVDYLTKPVNPRILRHKIGVFAELFRKTRALAELNEKLEARVEERTKELQRSEEALLSAAKQKDRFLATLAHELRNPLAPLRMGLDVLLRIEHPTPLARRTLAAMNRQLDHIVRLVDDLLDVSRISRGMLELKKQTTDLSNVIEHAVETSRPFFAGRRQTIEVTKSAAGLAFVDPTRIAQILSNLLHNASKYTPEGGAVRVTLAEEGSNVVIHVVDPGVGLAPDELERVFDMFGQIDRLLPSASGGLGIGLALSRQLALMHGGTLRATSDGIDRGSTFTLSLPRGPLEDRARQEPKGAVPTNGATAVHNVLVIEDNDDVAETLAAWLEQSGHAVQIARTGAEALARIPETRPAVVLCDIGLPGMDGVEVCRRVRSLGLDYRPVMVALTGWGQDADRRRTSEAGFDHHLVKPVAPDILRSILETVASDSKTS